MNSAMFRHLPNKRGGIDSICLRCLLTVAVGKYGSQLTRDESKHKCDPAQVEALELWLDKLTLI